jgi:hypothetical protein
LISADLIAYPSARKLEPAGNPPDAVSLSWDRDDLPGGDVRDTWLALRVTTTKEV